MVSGGNGASRHPMHTSAMWAILPRAMPDIPLPMVSALTQDAALPVGGGPRAARARCAKAHVAETPEHPETLHYTGGGVFMVSGKIISRRSQFCSGKL